MPPAPTTETANGKSDTSETVTAALSRLEATEDILDGIVGIAERLLILGIFVGIVTMMFVHVAREDVSQVDESKMPLAWLSILIIPLFYRTTRRLIERLRRGPWETTFDSHTKRNPRHKTKRGR